MKRSNKGVRYHWEDVLKGAASPYDGRNSERVFPGNPLTDDMAKRAKEAFLFAYMAQEPVGGKKPAGRKKKAGQCTLAESGWWIEIREQGLAHYNIPLVYITDGMDKKMLSECAPEVMIGMEIRSYLEREWEMKYLLSLLELYVRTPLRMERQKKRDAEAAWLNVISRHRGLIV